jgi:hypothetical protein
MMKYCCDRFSENVDLAGQAGIAIVVKKLGPYFKFNLQSRAVDAATGAISADQRSSSTNCHRRPNSVLPISHPVFKRTQGFPTT